MTITIRRANPDDALGLARVHILGWQTTYRGIIPDTYLDHFSLEERARRWDHLLHDPARGEFVFVAEQAGAIVGFASGGRNRSEDIPEYTGELWSIYLLREVQRHGLGKRLFFHVVDQLVTDGHDSMVLWVIRENPARYFYEGLGGVIVKTGTFEAGGAAIPELAYGWRDLAGLRLKSSQ